MAFRISAKRPLKKFQLLKKLLPFGKPIEVKRSAAPYIEQTGWQQSISTTPREWHGYYRTRFGSYPSLKTIVHTLWNRLESQSVTRWSFDACI